MVVKLINNIMNNVIYMSEYRKPSSVVKSRDNLTCDEVSVIMNNISNEKLFNIEFDDMNSTLRKRHNKYKFPSIISKYRKSINHIKSLYNALQESLFKYDTDLYNDSYNDWVFSLFRDKEWTCNLVSSINNDIKLIDKFIITHGRCDSTLILSKLSGLNTFKQDLSHYQAVFKLMNDWNCDHESIKNIKPVSR